MGEGRDEGTVGAWTYQHHRMARFDQGRIYAWVSATDDQGEHWTWVVSMPTDDETRSQATGEAPTALEAAQAADDAAHASLEGTPDPAEVARWSDEHLRWRAEADQTETDATVRWDRGRPKGD